MRHVGAIGKNHVALDGRQPIRDFLRQGHEGQIKKHQPVGGVVGDVDELILKQTRVKRVIDGAYARNAVPALQMTRGVPRQGRDTVADADAIAVKTLCELQGASPDFGVGRAMQRAFHRAGNNRTVGVLDRRVINHAVDQKRPVLHQSEHWRVSPKCFRFVATITRGARKGRWGSDGYRYVRKG